MADVVVSISVTNVQYTIWLRTSYIGQSIVSETGVPMIEQNELSPDQDDALNNFLHESTREVLKVFLSRQGDVTGIPFSFDNSVVTYRFKEEEPVLAHAASIKETLNEDVKNAIYVYATYLWFQFKGNDKQSEYMINRYGKLINNIDRHLYKLHD